MGALAAGADAEGATTVPAVPVEEPEATLGDVAVRAAGGVPPLSKEVDFAAPEAAGRAPVPAEPPVPIPEPAGVPVGPTATRGVVGEAAGPATAGEPKPVREVAELPLPTTGVEGTVEELG